MSGVIGEVGNGLDSKLRILTLDGTFTLIGVKMLNELSARIHPYKTRSFEFPIGLSWDTGGIWLSVHEARVLMEQLQFLVTRAEEPHPWDCKCDLHV